MAVHRFYAPIWHGLVYVSFVSCLTKYTGFIAKQSFTFQLSTFSKVYKSHFFAVPRKKVYKKKC